MPETSAHLPENDHADLVRGLYRGFLGREPDPTGLEYWRARLAEGASVDALLAALTA
ncbi:DUF4214 domain-containing protein, partial [Massilia sp. ST3]|uniref:DUF4214 domain-containing protein n=1 Tax=Massilia sp. ST3 TaxID=2824903 RepID=UPI001B812A75